MGLQSLLRSNPAAFIIIVPLLLYSVILHEIAHGWMALRFGDPTAKYAGRLSLNPVSHLDPFGLFALFFFGFGWAKPVPVDYSLLRRSRKAVILVSLAGCMTNILIATVILLLLTLNIFKIQTLAGQILVLGAQINIMLGAFNLIPIPPLDGSRVLMEFLPSEARYPYARLEPYGFFIIIILLYLGFLNPVIQAITGIIYFLISLLLIPLLGIGG